MHAPVIMQCVWMAIGSSDSLVITNSSTKGTITGFTGIGGFIWTTNGRIANSSSQVEIHKLKECVGSADSTGGFVGELYGGNINHCFAYGNIYIPNKGWEVGGFAGVISGNAVIENSFYMGKIEGLIF